jgi:HSP20 family protein
MLTRWNPFNELFRDEWWPSGRAGAGAGSWGSFEPAVDVFEEKNAIMLKADLPGMRPEDVEISVDGNVLSIRGERKFEHEEKEEGFRRVERRYGSFHRSFTLPDTVDFDKIDANMSQGTLTVSLPKSPKAQPRRIGVKSSEAAGEKGQPKVERRPEAEGGVRSHN